jgi:FK506-binding protein 4/5
MSISIGISKCIYWPPPPPEPHPEPQFALSEEDKAAMDDICGDGSLLKSVVKAGIGDKPEAGNNVKCHYTGRLLDGDKFDSSRDRGDPFSFKIGAGVITGWSEGVATMQVGEIAQFCIAPAKAYGDSGSPPKIPPKATLQFEIELLSFSEYEDVPGTDGKVQKKVLVDGEGWQRPKDNDICMINMQISLMAEDSVITKIGGADGPAEYVTSSGKAAGIAAALKDMKKGGKSIFVIQPELGYGEAGCQDCDSCPTVPPNAVLKAEIELVDFHEVTDVAKDGLLTMKTLEQGEGWKKPKDNDVVHLKYKICLQDGTVVKQSSDEAETIILGDGSAIPAIELACREMKKGAKVVLSAQPKYAFGEAGCEDSDSCPTVPPNATVTVDLELVSWYDVEDVSSDGGVLMTKKIESEEANDYKMPKDLGTVKFQYKLTLETGTVVVDTRVDGTGPVSHVVDENILPCPALELALKKMKKGGKSDLRISPQYGFGKAGSAEHGVPADATILGEIELIEFQNEKDSWDLNEEEKLTVADQKKSNGNEKVKSKDYECAIRRYEAAKTCLASDYKMTEDQKEKAKLIKISCHTNMAMCYEKLGDEEAVLKNCEEALKLDENCVKALFRRGCINSKRGNFDIAVADLRKAQSIDPPNGAVKKALAQHKRRQAAQDAKDRKRLGGMFDKMAKQDEKKEATKPSAEVSPAPAPVPAPAPPPQPLNLAEEDAGEEAGQVPHMEDALKIYEEGDSVEAARAFTRICKDDEDNSEAWRMLGQCHADNDDDQKAIRCLAAAVETDPENLKALAAIGVAYFNERQPDRALDHLRSWISRHPEYKTLADGNATTVEEVAAMYSRAAAQSSNDPEPRVVLAVLHNISEEYDDAVDALRVASKLAPQGTPHLRL